MSRRYQIPSLLDMRQKAGQLRAAYKKVERLSLVRQYEALQVHLSFANSPEDKERALLLAGLIFIDEIVKCEYIWGKATISSSWWLKLLGGSQMATIVEKQLLGLTAENQLGDDERLIYLNMLYHYINDYLYEDTLGNKTKAEWLADLIFILKKLRERNNQQLSKLQESTPALESIKQDLDGLRLRYETWGGETGYLWKPSDEREDALVFIDVIAASSLASHGGSIEKMSDQQYYQAQETIAGAILYRAMRIAREYKFHQPEFKKGHIYNSGSRLCSLFLDVLNAKLLSDIDPAIKILRLEALLVHLNIILKSTGKHAKNHVILQCKDEINDFIRQEKELMDQPSYVSQAISTGVGFAVRQTAPLLLAKVVAVDLLMPLVGRGAFSLVSGPVGLVIFGAGNMLLTAVDRFATTAILKKGKEIFMTDLKEIFSEWQSNLEFRENFKKNPEDALKKAGFELNEEDLSKIKALLTLNKSANEKLDERISK